MATYWSNMAEKIYATLIRHVHIFWRGVIAWPLRIFRRMIPCQKVELRGYQMMNISRSCFRSARHNTGCDRRTDTSLSQKPRYA